MGDGSARNGNDVKGKGRAQQNGDMLALDLDAAEGGYSSQFQQMQLVEQQVSPHAYYTRLFSWLDAWY